MKNLILINLICVLVCSCIDTRQDTKLKFPDENLINVKGNPSIIEYSWFIVDSSGKTLPDSVHSEVDEFRDHYLVRSVLTDLGQKNTEVGNYNYYESGLPKKITRDLNGKRVYSLEVDIDSLGFSAGLRTYDSAGNLTYFLKNLGHTDVGMVTAGQVFAPDSSLMSGYKIESNGFYFNRRENTDSSGKVTSIKYVFRQQDHEISVDSTLTFAGDSTSTVIARFRYGNYDSLKNWQQMTELDASGKPVKITKRKISYLKSID